MALSTRNKSNHQITPVQSLESLARAEETSTTTSEFKLPSNHCSLLRAGRDAGLKEYTTLQKLRGQDMDSFSVLHKQLAMLPVRAPAAAAMHYTEVLCIVLK